MYHLFEVIFYQPILNLLVFLYNTVSMHDLGIAIILLTVIIKLILWPLSRKSIKAQKEMQELQPKIDELKSQYKGKEKQQEMGKALMNLYKEHKVNPFSSCLPLLLQLPFFIAVYQVFSTGLSKHLDLVYSFIPRPEVNSIFLGFLDLSKPNIYLAILAGGAQFWQAKMMMVKKSNNAVVGETKEDSMAAIMNKQMLYFMPALTIFIGITLPGGLTLYWLVLTLLTVLQQLLMNRPHNNKGLGVIEGEIIK